MSLAEKISSYLFAGHLVDGEKIIYVAHKHFFILIKDSFKSTFLTIFLPIVFYFLFPELIFWALLWLGLGAVLFIYHFIDWYFDAWLLTNNGIVDVEWNGIFDRNSARVEYHMIEGVGSNIKGFWQTVLNYGDITIDKIGANTAIVLHNAEKPSHVEQLVLKYQEKFVTDKSFRDHNALKSMLSDMIVYHLKNGKISSSKDN